MTTRDIVAITGGAGMLGSALARLLVGSGHKVALLDTEHGKERATALAAELGAENACAYAGNFDRPEAWSDALETTRAMLGGRPTHAALIAGAFEGGAPVHATGDDAVWEKMMGSNADTAYRALRALLPGMVTAKSGSIVVVGSRASERPWASSGSAAYAASKAAVVTLAQAVAQEVLEHGVRVNAVLPSTLDTPVNRKAMPKSNPTAWVSLDSCAGVIAFLLSEAARDISGAAIPVYGRA